MKSELDIEKDNLTIGFNRGELRYMAYLPNGVPVLNLNARTEKILGKRNKELLMNPTLLAHEMQLSINTLRQEELERLGFPCTSFEVLYSSRNSSIISSDMSEYLRELTSEEDVLVGVHRTGSATLDNIAEILKYGLVMTRLNGNTTNSPIHLRNNVSYYPNNETVIKELINADAYKESLGAILIRIPDEDLARNIFMIDSESGDVILDPLYIVGFVPVGPDGYISEIITPYPPRLGAPFKKLEALYDEREYAKDFKSHHGSIK